MLVSEWSHCTESIKVRDQTCSLCFSFLRPCVFKWLESTSSKLLRILNTSSKSPTITQHRHTFRLGSCVVGIISVVKGRSIWADCSSANRVISLSSRMNRIHGSFWKAVDWDQIFVGWKNDITFIEVVKMFNADDLVILVSIVLSFIFF